MWTLRPIGFAALGFLLAGCYALHPVGGAVPEVGTQVAFDLNDVGRVAMGPSMGSEIAQIEGRLVEKANGEYIVAVSAIRQMRGGEQVWTGEKVLLKDEYLGTTYERRFSRGRTVAATAITVGAFAALVLSRSILGFFSDEEDPEKKPPIVELTRP